MGEIKTDRKLPENSSEIEETVWKKPLQKLYRRKVIMLFPPEDDGLISVYAADLPGVASQGHSEVEALKNIVDAFEAAFAVYRESKEEIPWIPSTSPLEAGSEIRWVFVNG